MKNTTLYLLWGGLFIVCAGLGFIPEPEGFARFILTAVSAAFFVPPVILLLRARAEEDKHSLQLIRSFSAASLGLTVILLICTILTAAASDAVGKFLHAMLVIVSSPMICSGYWAASLFLWACLLVASLRRV